MDRENEIRQQMAAILGNPENIDIDKIEDVYEHAIQYQLDDADVDRFQELREELNRIKMEKEQQPKEVDRETEIRQQMAEILGNPANVDINDIENVYEHDIQYQLDDADVDRFQELREELNNIKKEKQQAENQSEQTEEQTNENDAYEMTDKNRLEARINAYEEGASYEDEARIVELRESIIKILDEHGLKENDGTAKVKPGEGQVVSEEFAIKVADMRNELRELSAKRTNVVSQRGEDVLPTLKELQTFLNEQDRTPSEYQDEVARRLEENQQKLEKLKSSDRDSARVQELFAEIDEINTRLANIEEQVKQNPNYDAESIERTSEKIKLYHRQNELTGILRRNPAAREASNNTREIAKLENIISELSGIQNERSAEQSRTETGTSTVEIQGQGDETRQDENSDFIVPREDGTGVNIERQGTAHTETGDTRTEDPSTSTVGVAVDPEQTEDEEDRDTDSETEKDDNETVQVKVGFFRGILLKFIRGLKKIFHAKDGGFLDKVESGVLIGTKKTSAKLSDGAKKKVEAEVEKEEEDPDLADSKWALSKLSEFSSMDKNSLLYGIINESYENTRKEREGMDDTALVKYVKKKEVPSISGKENGEGAFDDLLCYNIAGEILDRAKDAGIETEKGDDDARPIQEVYADLEKKYLREKTDAVSREAAAKRESGETNGRETATRETDSTEK